MTRHESTRPTPRGAAPRGSLWPALELPLATLAAVWVAMFTWHGFTQDTGGFWIPALVVGLAIALVGAALRWYRQPAPLVVLGQLVAGLVVLGLLLVGNPIPGPALVQAVHEAFLDAQSYAAPVPARNGVTIGPLLVATATAVLLVVDVVACTWRRVTLAGLPLLAVYAVPLGLLGQGVPWGGFVLTAVLFLLMLFVHQQQVLGRWGRPLGARSEQSGWRPHNDAIRVSATLIAATALAAAVILPAAIPSADLAVFDGGPGAGHGSKIAINNPTVTLNHDLKQSADEPLLQITSDSSARPDYLQISILNRFSGTEWSSGDRQVPSSQRAEGPLPPLPGVDESVPRTDTHYTVDIGPDFSSTWLPVMSPVSAVSTDSDWRYDLATRDFIAGNGDLTTAGMTYSMTGEHLDLSAQELSADSYRAATMPAELRYLPSDFPSSVRELAYRVTADAGSPFEKAVALQNWFRSDFDYSLKAPEGDSSTAIAEFVQSRTGYCQQFSATMAAMARVLGIPSRVVVGFLQPSNIGADTWQYSTNDLHAWPELYFEGAGWVRFEPTPATRAGATPGYTQTDLGPGGGLPDTNGQSGPNEVIPKTDPTPSARPRRSDGVPEQTTPEASAPAASSSGASDGHRVALVGVVVAVLVVVGLGLLPGAVRRRRRTQRLAGGPEEGFAEVRATCLDLGLPWPEGRSPREAGRAVARLLPPDPEPRAALERLVGAVEQQRYARVPARPDVDAGNGATGPAADVEIIGAALRAAVAPRVRLRAVWLPASVLSRSRSQKFPVRPTASTGTVLD